MLVTVLCRFLLPSCLIYRNLKIKICKTLILLASYGCVTWSLTLREEHRLRVFENRVLRRVLGPKREEVAGEDNIMRGLHNLCISPNIIRVTAPRRVR
jgi:hypothetical protein